MQYLPVPVMILNNLKTVVQANEAMARMLDLLPEGAEDDSSATLEKLRGQTLSQVGIDMLQDGRPVWLTWDTFFDTMVDEMGIRGASGGTRRESINNGDSTPTAAGQAPTTATGASSASSAQNAVVEVVISRKTVAKPNPAKTSNDSSTNQHIYAKMITSIWEVEERQPFFTLTFTSSQSRPSSLVQSRKSIARPGLLEAAGRPSITNSNSSSVTSSRDSNSPSFHSPGIVTMSSSPFPPMGPPAMASQSSTPSLLQKMLLIKDALLDNTEMPILAMWKDGSATFPNKAARKLFGEQHDSSSGTDGFAMIEQWQMWNEDFTQQLMPDEFPISILIKTEKPFSNMRIGTYRPDGQKVVFDVLGEAIRDDTTSEFLAGVVTCRDVTTMTDEIVQIKERDEEREEHFRLICDTMPQMVWTATPDGMHDYFNSGWYEYTGLTEEESMGLGWQIPFHSDDLEEARPRWLRALETGEAYEVEYRCKSKEGEWRWFLGRAAPARNKETGEVEKWFGKLSTTFERLFC
jgi:PAS domain S-box-containing protein